MLVGGKDILIPTMMVGNYPKPRWYNGADYAKVPQGNFVSDSISYEAFEDCIAAIVLDQERAGIDVISDGRVYGGGSAQAGVLYSLTAPPQARAWTPRSSPTSAGATSWAPRVICPRARCTGTTPSARAPSTSPPCATRRTSPRGLGPASRGPSR